MRDDGAGIYTFAGQGSAFRRYVAQTIRRNIVLNAVGAPAGAGGGNGSARGIYLDEGSRNVLVDSNTVANCIGAGLYGNSDSGCTFRGNNVFNCGFGWAFQRLDNTPQPVTGMRVVGNSFVPYSVEFTDLEIDRPTLVTNDQSMQRVGVIDSNLYTRFAATLISTRVGRTNYVKVTRTLDAWNALGLDGNSRELVGNWQLFYNATGATVEVALSGTWVTPSGSTFNGILPGYSSTLLLQTVTPPANILRTRVRFVNR